MSKAPTPADIEAALSRFMRDLERVKPRDKTYLGMSSIGQDSDKIYLTMLKPAEVPSDSLCWYHWAGYMFEVAIMDALAAYGIPLDPAASQREIVADFDNRFRGHIDGATKDGKTVIEVKTLTWRKYQTVREKNAAYSEHIEQVLCYMRHGGFERGLIVYAPRDIDWRFWSNPYHGWTNADETNHLAFGCIEILPDEERQDALDQKAQMILSALDNTKGGAPINNGRQIDIVINKTE